MNNLKVKLLSVPTFALGTLYYVWEQSRTNNELPTPEEIEKILHLAADCVVKASEYGRIAEMLGAQEFKGGEWAGVTTTVRQSGKIVYPYLDIASLRKTLWDTIEKILDEDIPCTENLNFVFALENVPIALREQLVRHRIGVHVGERVGVDIVPELGSSSWWSQTMRMLPMGSFMKDGRYIVPETLSSKTLYLDDGKVGDLVMDDFDEGLTEVTAEQAYLALLEQIEFTYNKMIEAGVPMEDARQIIPLAATHSITWCLNLKAMMHIIGKRACWVAQVGLWESLIAQMVDLVAEAVHPMLRKMTLPPCFKRGKYEKCPYFQINTERVQGRDHMPPCPLYVMYQTQDAVQAYLQWESNGNKSTWSPVEMGTTDGRPGTIDLHASTELCNWGCSELVEEQMLYDNAKKFERLWKFDFFKGVQR